MHGGVHACTELSPVLETSTPSFTEIGAGSEDVIQPSDLKIEQPDIAPPINQLQNTAKANSVLLHNVTIFQLPRGTQVLTQANATNTVVGDWLV